MTAGMLIERAFEFSAIAFVALTASRLLRRRSAALRHWVLSAAVIAAALMPLLNAVVPAWQVPVAALARGSSVPAPPLAADASPSAGAAPQPVAAAAPAGAAVNVGTVLLAMWIAGVAVNAGLLIGGLVRLRRIRSRSRPVNDQRWLGEAADIARACGVRRPVLLSEGDDPGMLVTWGAARPLVLLPRAARGWTTEQMRVVLWHELSHVKRGDWLLQLGAEFVRALHWFNPLAWMLCRRLRHESERAADDAVLSAGVDGRDYAAHLLELARAVRRRRDAWWPAPAMVRQSTLERRVAAMLARDVNRAPLTRFTRVATLGAVLAVAAAVASAQAALASFSGSVLDPSNRTVPNVEVTVTNIATNAAHKVRSDQAGRFEFAELPPGDYAFEARFPGFMTLRGRVTMSGAHVQQPLQLQVGSVQETILVVAASGPVQQTQEGVGAPSPARRSRTVPSSTCESSPYGGNIRPPMKLVDSKPFYPPHLASAGVAGTVIVQGVIGKDGVLKDLQVVQSPHEDLQAAALTAVREWQFTGTMLNCMPIDVAITINIEFRVS